MGDCVSAEQRRPNNNTSGQNNPNSKAATKPTPTTVNPTQHKNNNLQPIIRPTLPSALVNPTSNPKLKNDNSAVPNEFFELKAPKNFKTWTQFQWIKEPKYKMPEELAKQSSSTIKNRSFQEKYFWFRTNLEKLRIHWSSGKSDYLQVDRANLLMSSNAQFEQINFHKEVKIEFKDQKDTTDAGGLLREWMNLCIHQIFSPDLGMLSLCDTTTTFYKFNYNQHVGELFQVAAKILGTVIGKAIFQRIPLKCFLNYTILRQICSQPVQLNDIFTYDQDFYRGWFFMVYNNSITMLDQNFCVYEFDEHGTQITVPLKQNGFHIMVNSTNKDEYIALMMKHYCTSSVQKMIENIRYGIYKIIPYELLSVFQPQELDIIINGKKEIDLQDLKKNIKYTNYSPEDQVISWFWEYVNELSQEQLEHVLHFVTGNSRVPILGFKYLQSNRGEYQLFQIKKIPFNQKDPYPKSHTCFNRLELPVYPSRQLFDKNIIYIAVENKYFGLQ